MPAEQPACRCGCGETPSPGGNWPPGGHDHRALHQRIALIGTTAEFCDWFDETFQQPELSRRDPENGRLRKIIAHLMTNPLDTREHTCHTSDIDEQAGRVEITEDADDRTTIRVIDPIHEANETMTRDLGQVLDIEAGLAEALSTGPADNTQRAAATINDGLETLFRKLGPPTDHDIEK